MPKRRCAPAKSADYTVTDTDRIRTLLYTTGASTFTATLPTAADNAHRIITVKKVDSGAGLVVVEGEGAETVDGNTSVALYWQYDAVTLVSDGSNWHMISADHLGHVYTHTALAVPFSEACNAVANTYKAVTGVFFTLTPGTYIVSFVVTYASTDLSMIGVTDDNAVTGLVLTSNVNTGIEANGNKAVSFPYTVAFGTTKQLTMFTKSKSGSGITIVNQANLVTTLTNEGTTAMHAVRIR